MENNAITQPALPYEEATSVIPGADILIVTGDEIFLANAREGVALPNRTWHAASVLEAADKLAAQPCAVIVLDVALGQSRLREIIARLRGQFPDLACIIAGEQKDEPEAASLLVSGEIQGFVFKHHTARQLAKILPLGIDRHFRLKEEAARSAGGSGKRAPMAIAIGLAAIAAIALGAWLALRGGAEKPVVKSLPATVAPASKAASAAAASVNEAAMIEKELARAEAALLANDPANAAAALENVKALAPNHPRVAFLNAQLTRELERSAAERKAAASAEQTRQQLAEFVKREQEREEQEFLAAQQRLEAERQKAEEQARAEALAAAAAEQARAAAAAAAIEAQKAPPETREQLRARRQRELLEKPEVVNAAKVARQAQPQYPERAQREGVEGYVDVSFTVSTTGEVKDVVAVGAQPKGQFEEASLRAVKKWKFEPKRIEGDLYEQRMTVRLTYKLSR